ncbi:TlpA family protein disulfide reductase [Candidatus Poribacteria bacterium]|nr:TlpA family protein disulfide reductase [Candidatus Poribacteria bacterium]
MADTGPRGRRAQGRIRILAALLLMFVSPLGADVERVEILSGFYTSNPEGRPKRIDFLERIYTIDLALVPLDRPAIRQTPILFADRMPAGTEFFRDDMEAFDAMLHRGGLLILLCAPDAGSETLSSFNYLGNRFGFRFSSEVQPGDIVPAKPGEGPFGGNVWLCGKGARVLEAPAGEWKLYFQTAQGSQPAIMSRRVGEGFLLVLGTDEITGQSGREMHNALTLIQWARKEMAHEEAPGAKVEEDPDVAADTEATSETAGSLLGAARRRRSSTDGIEETPVPDDEAATPELPPSAKSDAELLQERLAEMRAANQKRRAAAVQPEKPKLLPAVEGRPYFPRMGFARDLEGKPVEFQAGGEKVFLIYYWATWSPGCREEISRLIELQSRLDPGKFEIIGISLDKSVERIRDWQRELGMNWRQLCDEGGWDSRYAEVLKVRSLPASFLIDRDGRICAADLEVGALEAAINEALGE